MIEVRNIPRLRFENFHQDWKQSTIGDNFEIVGGGTPSTTNSEYWNGNINWFTPTEIKGRQVSSSVRKITPKGLKNSSAKILPIKTLLFTSRATIGEMSFTTQECTTNQGFQSILPTTDNDNRFFYYWSTLNKRIFLRKSTGSTFLEISKKTLEKIQILIPSLPEQQKIADFLTAVDKRIELLEKKKTLLETYKKGVMKKIFNKEIRFKDDKGNNFHDWEEKRLGELMSDFIVPMRDKPKDLTGDIPWCRIEDFEGIYLSKSKSNQGVSMDTIREMNLKIHPKNTILVSCSANLGFCSIVEEPLVTNQTFIGLVPSQLVVPEFIYYTMILSSRKLNILSSGTTISYLSRKQFEKFSIRIPSNEEQLKISKFLLSLDKQLELMESQINKSKTWKKGLLQKMFV